MADEVKEQENEGSGNWTVRVNSGLKPILLELADLLGYNNNASDEPRYALAITNSIRVGCRLAKQDITLFLSLLNGNS